MSNSSYAVLKSKPLQGVPWNYNASAPSKKLKYSHASPHYHIVAQAGQQEYTIVVNIESRDQSTPMVLYYIDENYQNAILDKLVNGFNSGSFMLHPESLPSDIALDYVRGNLFDHTKMQTEQYLPDGEDSLNTIIDGYVQAAIKGDCDMYAFGMEFADNLQNMGVHDIHMNQGNEAKYASDDGIYQDGGLFIHDLVEDKWIAMFFAFQSQSFDTDENGHRID
jgi:uncharacterized protein YukJ